jgi:hypothetical protein
MVDAVHHGHLGEVEWTHPIQAGHVHAVLRLVGSSLVMRLDPAAAAEKVLCHTWVEAVGRERILALQDPVPPVAAMRPQRAACDSMSHCCAFERQGFATLGRSTVRERLTAVGSSERPTLSLWNARPSGDACKPRQEWCSDQAKLLPSAKQRELLLLLSLWRAEASRANPRLPVTRHASGSQQPDARPFANPDCK